MSQSTRRRVAEKIDSPREGQEPSLHRDPRRRDGQGGLGRRGGHLQRSIYTPFVTLCTFLSQVLDPDHSCRAAVARLIVWLAIHDRKPCSEQTGTYCDARLRLPLGVVVRLVRQTGRRGRGRRRRRLALEGAARAAGRRHHRLDARHPRNQAAFPQPKLQAPGLGFPVVRMVAIIALATGVVRDLAMGPYEGKETGETALFRALWDGLEPGEIVLGDRVFASFFGDRGPLRAGRRRAVPDAPAAEVRLPPGPAAGGRGPRGDLDQAGAARLDGRGDLLSGCPRVDGARAAVQGRCSRGSGSTSWCW